MILFEGDIPTEEESTRIENLLCAFGRIIPNHHREAKLVSFVITEHMTRQKCKTSGVKSNRLFFQNIWKNKILEYRD